MEEALSDAALICANGKNGVSENFSAPSALSKAGNAGFLRSFGSFYFAALCVFPEKVCRNRGFFAKLYKTNRIGGKLPFRLLTEEGCRGKLGLGWRLDVPNLPVFEQRLAITNLSLFERSGMLNGVGGFRRTRRTFTGIRSYTAGIFNIAWRKQVYRFGILPCFKHDRKERRFL